MKKWKKMGLTTFAHLLLKILRKAFEISKVFHFSSPSFSSSNPEVRPHSSSKNNKNDSTKYNWLIFLKTDEKILLFLSRRHEWPASRRSIFRNNDQLWEKMNYSRSNLPSSSWQDRGASGFFVGDDGSSLLVDLNGYESKSRWRRKGIFCRFHHKYRVFIVPQQPSISR